MTLVTNQDLDPQRLREAFGHHPSGVVALAAEVDGQRVGLAASSFTSVSLEPPLVSVSVASTSKTWPTLRRSSHLGITVLADHHDLVCRQLAGPVEQRFEGLACTVSPEGAVTLDDGLARFDCTVYREVEAGDLLVEVLGKYVDALLVVVVLREQLDLGDRLVRERVRHHERRVAGRVAEVEQPSFGEHDDRVAVAEGSLVDLRLDRHALGA